MCNNERNENINNINKIRTKWVSTLRLMVKELTANKNTFYIRLNKYGNTGKFFQACLLDYMTIINNKLDPPTTVDIIIKSIGINPSDSMEICREKYTISLFYNHSEIFACILNNIYDDWETPDFRISRLYDNNLLKCLLGSENKYSEILKKIISIGNTNDDINIYVIKLEEFISRLDNNLMIKLIEESLTI